MQVERGSWAVGYVPLSAFGALPWHLDRILQPVWRGGAWQAYHLHEGSDVLAVLTGAEGAVELPDGLPPRGDL